MSVFEDSTINGWLAQPGPINLRQTQRVDRTRKDLAAAEGIIKSALVGVILIAAAVILWELLR